MLNRLEEVITALVGPEARKDEVRMELASVLLGVAQELHTATLSGSDPQEERLERIDARVSVLVAEGVTEESAFQQACLEED